MSLVHPLREIRDIQSIWEAILTCINKALSRSPVTRLLTGRAISSSYLNNEVKSEFKVGILVMIAF